jgi:hypothetical protein
MTIADLLNAKFGNNATVCDCQECVNDRTFKMLDDVRATYNCRTVPEVVAVMKKRERVVMQ